MRRLLVPLIVLMLSACGSSAKVEVSDPVVALSPVSGRPGVAYFSLHAKARPMKLLGITSPRVGRIELHDSGMAGGMMQMGPLKDNSFGSDGEMVFKAGGRHAMLFDVDPTVKPGGTIPLIFDFDNAPDLTVTVAVKAMGSE